MQREVLEGLDLRGLPAVLLRPVDGQHVVGELLAEQQLRGVRLGLQVGVSLDREVRSLSPPPTHTRIHRQPRKGQPSIETSEK